MRRYLPFFKIASDIRIQCIFFCSGDKKGFFIASRQPDIGFKRSVIAAFAVLKPLKKVLANSFPLDCRKWLLLLAWNRGRMVWRPSEPSRSSNRGDNNWWVCSFASFIQVVGTSLLFGSLPHPVACKGNEIWRKKCLQVQLPNSATM